VVTPLHLSHFQALLLFSLVIAVAFGFLTKLRPVERLKYALWAFLMFMLVAVALGWAMFPLSR